MNELLPPKPPLEIVPHPRGNTVIYECDVCGKLCKLKKSHYDKSEYHYCSRACFNEHKKVTFKGERNHQFGLRGPLNATFIDKVLDKKNNKLDEKLVYVGLWYAKKTQSRGRIKEHRYLVELNHDKYPSEFFEKIGDWWYLKDKVEVHHIDFNHNNNELSNLMPMTKGDHISLHNRHRNQKRENGKFVKA